MQKNEIRFMPFALYRTQFQTDTMMGLGCARSVVGKVGPVETPKKPNLMLGQWILL